MSKPPNAKALFLHGETPISQRTRAHKEKNEEEQIQTDTPIAGRTRLHDVKDKVKGTRETDVKFAEPVSRKTRKHDIEPGLKRGLEEDKPDHEVSQPKRGRITAPAKKPALKKASVKRTRDVSTDEDSGLENSKENVFNEGAVRKISQPAKPAGRAKSTAKKSVEESQVESQEETAKSVKPASKKARGKLAVLQNSEDEVQEEPSKSTTRGRGKSTTRKPAKEMQAESGEEPAKSVKPVTKKAREKSAVRQDVLDEDKTEKTAAKSVSRKGRGKTPAEEDEVSVEKMKKQSAPKNRSKSKTNILSDDATTAKSKAAPKKSIRKPGKKKETSDEEIEKNPKLKKGAKATVKGLEKSVIFAEDDSNDTTSHKRPKRQAASKESWKLISDSEDEREDEDIGEILNKSNPKSKRKIVIPDSDSGDDTDFKLSNDEESSESEVEADPSEKEESEPESKEETPKKGRKRAKPEKKPRPWSESRNKKKNQDKPSQSVPTIWPHLSYDFLKPENIMDANKNRPDHPDYDPKTLYVPQKFLDKEPPSLRQWWEIKQKNFDSIILSNICNFYEMHHMDAVVAVKELHLSFNKGSHARTGFFQTVYGRNAECLIAKGYKLVRFEQVENGEMAAERYGKMKNPSKVDKIVKREVCQKVCKGTRVQTVFDAEITAPSSKYMLTLVEKINPETKNSQYGVCFVDTTIGEFYLGQFEDDHSNTRLLTLISHYPPVYIVYEKNHLSQPVSKLLKAYLPEALFEPLLKGKQFWSSDQVLEHLKQESYFEKVYDKMNWPKGLRPFLLEEDSEVYINPNEELALNAFGGCVYILKDSLIDHRLLSQSLFRKYDPLDFAEENEAKFPLHNNMVLDAMTIKNLDILHGPGSLLHLLDRCVTSFGKRLLREWICRPSCRKEEIILRQDAINELAKKKHVADKIRTKLKSVGDLERLLSKMHAYGNVATARNHPEARALVWDIKGLRKKKVKDFEKTYTGFQDLTKIVEMFEDCKSNVIKNCTQTEPNGSFPDLSQHLEYFRDSFDHKLALSDGMINPKPGMDEEYDNVNEKLNKIDEESKEYLKKQKKHFDEDTVKFHKIDTQNFLLKVPENAKDKAQDDDYELESKTKGFRMYSTDVTKDLSSRYNEAEELKKSIVADIDRRLFAKFSENYPLWLQAVRNVAILDVLLSLADYARGESTCVPEVNNNTKAKENFYIDIKNGRHPCLANENFIANDTVLGKTGKFFMILTGPNMGGKSTLMRQVGLIVIMSQMGCLVPAESCKITITDRIFTRLGARDDIVSGQSTFLVELSETALILQHATPYSLVLLDELGRGTSTFDGTAIASAVVRALLLRKCRTLFSTHYHSLIEDYAADPNIMLAHMGYTTRDQKENSEEDDENVAFLYELTEGACPKSYGFNAARLAGIPPNIIRNARSIANDLEREFKQRHAFKTIFEMRDISLDRMKRVLKDL